jgi:hypothetical protein
MATSKKSGNGNKKTLKFHNPNNTGAQPQTIKINLAYKGGTKRTPFVSGKRLIR